MNKKLILNKETIAQLTNPERIFGGEGENGTGSQTCWQTCLATCQDYTCEDTCPTAVTCDEANTCNPSPYAACRIHVPDW